jgi:hypothetical protein
MKAFAQNRTTIDFTAVFRSIEIVAICFDTASAKAGQRRRRNGCPEGAAGGMRQASQLQFRMKTQTARPIV